MHIAHTEYRYLLRHIFERACSPYIYYINSKWSSWKLKLNWGERMVSIPKCKFAVDDIDTSTFFSFPLAFVLFCERSLWRQHDVCWQWNFLHAIIVTIYFWQFRSVANVSLWFNVMRNVCAFIENAYRISFLRIPIVHKCSSRLSAHWFFR